MDATRTRRTKDRARQAWYAAERQRRFARHMGFLTPATTAEALLNTATTEPESFPGLRPQDSGGQPV
jgi:hypothetical protein